MGRQTIPAQAEMNPLTRVNADSAVELAPSHQLQ